MIIIINTDGHTEDQIRKVTRKVTVALRDIGYDEVIYPQIPFLTFALEQPTKLNDINPQ